MKKTIYTLGVGLLMIPMLAFAISDTSSVSSYQNYSEEQLVQLIAKLQKQLDDLRKNQVQCQISDVYLSLGDGEDETSKIYVKKIQAFLKEKGHFYLNPTGYFGKITKTSLIAFQKANGLEQTGELDKNTRTYINGLKCKNSYYYEVKTKIEEKKTTDTSKVSSITASVSGNVVKWTTNGYSKNGYKIVWSKNSTPTYPTREGDQYIYLSEPSANSTELNAFNGSGTYYVRVCEYLGGACGVYSNELTTTL